MTKRLHPVLKLALEIGPLLVFFFINSRMGIFWATGAFMAALVISLITMYALVRRVPTLPLVTGVFVLIFGGLTLILQDEFWFKIKPTAINTLFGLILLGGMFAGKSFLKTLMADAIQMTDQGWRILTIRWALFFFLLAVLNEIVWRNYTTDEWVSFKVFGIMPLTILFSLTQVPTMFRHRIEDDPDPA